MSRKIKIVRADITTLSVDAIVNAANRAMCGGGGVDGAIHRAAGPELLAECRTLGTCETGSAKITKAYRLPAKYIIHAVGPVWEGGDSEEDQLLASCYRAVLSIAEEHSIRTLVFPAISCGAYRFPLDRAAKIAMKAVAEGLELSPGIESVTFAIIDSKVESAFIKSLREVAG